MPRLPILPGAAAFLASFVLCLVLANATAFPDTTESIRGTVDRLRPRVLVLRDVQFPDGSKAGKNVMLVVNKETVYFAGVRQATKEDLLPGLRVLVACKPAGTGRLAVQVRIIGGSPDGGPARFP